MCIICVELDKNKLSPWEAKRNLSEMAETLDDNHIKEVEDKILDKIFTETFIFYDDMYSNNDTQCEFCPKNECTCNWGENDD